MGVKIREKRNRLYLIIHHNGKRTEKALGLSITENKAHNREALRLAEIARNETEQQLFRQRWGLQDELKAKKSLYQYMKEIGEARTPKDKINKCLHYLESFPGGDAIQIQQITGTWIENFQTYLLRDTGLSQTTAYHYATAVRYALNKAVRENIILKNPAESVRGIALLESDKVFLNSDEMQRFAKVEIAGKLWPEIRRAFLFSCFTGLRISDLKSLTWGDIEREPLQIKKRQQKTKNFVYIPLNPTAWEIINDKTIHKYDAYVFPVIAESLTNTNHYLKRAAELAEIEKPIGWHTARHTFATLTLENGADFFTVSKLLGHTKTSTTAVYTKATDKLRREAVNALPGIDLTRAGGER
jgi:site-specific recombinase XerD